MIETDNPGIRPPLPEDLPDELPTARELRRPSVKTLRAFSLQIIRDWFQRGEVDWNDPAVFSANLHQGPRISFSESGAYHEIESEDVVSLEIGRGRYPQEVELHSVPAIKEGDSDRYHLFIAVDRPALVLPQENRPSIEIATAERYKPVWDAEDRGEFAQWVLSAYERTDDVYIRRSIAAQRRDYQNLMRDVARFVDSA